MASKAEGPRGAINAFIMTQDGATLVLGLDDGSLQKYDTALLSVDGSSTTEVHSDAGVIGLAYFPSSVQFGDSVFSADALGNIKRTRLADMSVTGSGSLPQEEGSSDNKTYTCLASGIVKRFEDTAYRIYILDSQGTITDIDPETLESSGATYMPPTDMNPSCMTVADGSLFVGFSNGDIMRLQYVVGNAGLRQSSLLEAPEGAPGGQVQSLFEGSDKKLYATYRNGQVIQMDAGEMNILGRLTLEDALITGANPLTMASVYNVPRNTSYIRA